MLRVSLIGCELVDALATLCAMSTTVTGIQRRGRVRIKRTTYGGRVAALVRARMAFLDINQTELGEALGVTQPYVSRRLSGAVPFDVVELAAVAELLGAEVAEFLPGDDDDSSPVDEFRRRRDLAASRDDAVTPKERAPLQIAA